MAEQRSSVHTGMVGDEEDRAEGPGGTRPRMPGLPGQGEPGVHPTCAPGTREAKLHIQNGSQSLTTKRKEKST